MSTHAATLLILFIANAFGSIESLDVSAQDLDLLNQELSVFDDDGQLVTISNEMPNELETMLISMDSHVHFFLFTRETGDNYELLTIGDVEHLRNTSFDPARETKFVTHGWVNSGKSKCCILQREAYLMYGDYNVIVIDWGKIAKNPYIWAATHVVNVGKYVAKMLDFLIDEGIDLSTTTLSGHSLGAHIVGLAGYYAKGKPNYIVGLDPALPLFSFAGVGSRISTQDAKQVEIIHTNAGLLGFLSPIGDADYYPNGGTRQKGCSVDLAGACSHSRSYEFFAESIVSDIGFYAMNCKDYSSFVHGTCTGEVSLMGGFKESLPSNGTYYLGTRGKYPYAKGRN